MSFLVWIAMLVGGLVLKAQNPEPFDGAHLAGGILFWTAVVAMVINLIIFLVIFAVAMRD